jgi:hypothetical protein
MPHPAPFLLILAALVPCGLLSAADAEPGIAGTQTAEDRLAERVRALERRLETAPALAPRARLVDLSLDVVAAAGGSTADEAALEQLKAGGHDPKRNGVTLQGAELAIAGAVDPYFTARMQLIGVVDGGEVVIEVEEAFVSTSALPFGLEVKGGLFRTAFGRINPTHVHAWAWMDQPVIHGRVFGADGARGPGASVAWRLPLPEGAPLTSQLLIAGQNADAETMPSFLGAGHGEEEEAGDEEHGETGPAGWPVGDRGGSDGLDDIVWTGRWDAGLDHGGTTWRAGLSGMHGPNATSGSARTVIWGADLAAKWRFNQGRFLQVEAEWVERRVEGAGVAGFFVDDNGTPADDTDDIASDLEGRTLVDQGLVAMVQVAVRRDWIVGLRGERAWALEDGPHGDEEPRSADATRDARIRVSPMLFWRPSEFSRLRLQYDYDLAEHLGGGPAHSIWLGVEMLLGAHPPHAF